MKKLGPHWNLDHLYLAATTRLLSVLADLGERAEGSEVHRRALEHAALSDLLLVAWATPEAA
jgi:hypothetical protein